MNGLFSNNPEMTRAMNYGTNLAGVPAGRVALALSPVMGQMAQQATGGLMSGLGVESPEAKKERALQAILGGIDPQDANSLADASRKLMGMGLSAEAQQMMEEARKVAESQSKVGKDLAQANYYGAQSQKVLTGGTDNTLTETELYAEWAKEGGHEYAINKLRELRATKPFAPQQVPKLSVPQDFNAFLAAKGMTVEQFMQQPEEVRAGMTAAYEQSPFFKNPVKGAGSGRPVSYSDVGISVDAVNQFTNEQKAQLSEIMARNSGDIAAARNDVADFMKKTNNIRISDEKVLKGVSDSTKIYSEISEGADRMAEFLKNNTPVSVAVLQASIPSFATNGARAQAEIERVISSGSLPQNVADRLSKWAKGDLSAATKEDYALFVKAMKDYAVRGKADAFRSNLQVYGNSPLAKQNPKAFIEKHGANVVKEGDASGDERADGIYEINGKTIVKLNGKFYEVK